MSLPRIATREKWLAAREDLLAKEKELTRQRDARNAERRNLEGEEGLGRAVVLVGRSDSARSASADFAS